MKIDLKPKWDEWFTYNENLYTIWIILGKGRKPPKINGKNKEKEPRLVTLPTPPLYDM